MADGITTTFSDNVEITAEDMDNIALDLGAPEFAGFSADVKFGNTALNGITAALVSSGILNLEDRCKCTLTDGKISVAKGVAVFADGSKIRITEPQTLDVIAGGTNYVYLKNDTLSGKAALENSLTEPDVSSGYNLGLCTLVNETLTDTRKFAQARTENNLNTPAYKVVAIDSTTVNNGYAEVTVPIPPGTYKYIIFPFQNNGMSIVDIDNKKSDFVFYNTTEGDYVYGSSSAIIFRSSYSRRTSKSSDIILISISENELKLRLETSRDSETFNQTFLLI